MCRTSSSRNESCIEFKAVTLQKLCSCLVTLTPGIWEEARVWVGLISDNSHADDSEVIHVIRTICRGVSLAWQGLFENMNVCLHVSDRALASLRLIWDWWKTDISSSAISSLCSSDDNICCCVVIFVCSRDDFLHVTEYVQGIVHQRMKILSSFIYPHSAKHSFLLYDILKNLFVHSVLFCTPLYGSLFLPWHKKGNF